MSLIFLMLSMLVLNYQEIPNDKNDYSISYINKGVVYARTQNYDSAVLQFNSALTLAIEQKDTSNILKSYRNLGLCYKYLNEPLQSVNSYLAILAIINGTDRFISIEGRTLNSLGLIYLGANSNERAKFYFEQAIKRDPESKSYHIWLNNLANTKLELREFNSAIQDYKLSLSLKEKLGVEKERLALLYNNLGEALFRSGNLSEAKNYLDSALYFRQNRSDVERIYTWNNMAWYYLKMNSLDSSKMYLSKSARVINQSVNSEKIKYYQLKRDLAEQVKDYNDYLVYDELYDSLNDLTFKESRLMLQELQSEYEIDRRDNELNQQEELLAAQETIITKNTNLLILVIAIAIIVFSSAIYFVLLNRRNKKLAARNELLVREQNHRVKNNLQMISSLLSLQAGKSQDEVSKDALKQSQGRIQAIALLNRSLYDHEEIGDVSLRDYIQDLITEVINSITDAEVKYELDIGDIRLDIEKTTSLGLIINELIVNSVKYVKQSVIEFSLSIKKSADNFSLEYADNGENFDLEKYQKSKSFGKRLIELQAQQLKGRSSIASKPGFLFQLSFS